MSYTGHKNTNMPDGSTLVDWIAPTVADECGRYGVEMPSKKQMAVVISALRMHTIIMHAAEYDYSELGKSDQKTEYWPMQSSIGRYFRDAGHAALDGEKVTITEVVRNPPPGNIEPSVVDGEKE